MTAGQKNPMCVKYTCSDPIVTCEVSSNTGLDADNDIKL